MPSFWTPTIAPVQTGEAVDASVTNRPTVQLSAQNQYLYDQLQSLSQTSGRLVTSGVLLGAGAVAGSVVFFNPVTGRYEPALATFTYASGQGEVAASTHACGLVLSVDASGLGDVLLKGVIDPSSYGLSPANWLDRAGTAFTSGTFYLSRLSAGAITPTISAPVVSLGYFDAGSVVFDPVPVGDFCLHRHQAFDVAALPAASQNTALTGFSATTHLADSFFSAANPPASAPVIAVGFRVTTAQVTQVPTRLDVCCGPTGLMELVVFAGEGVVYANPNSTSPSSINLGEQAWPQYGQYVAVPLVGLEIFFLRTDGNYADTTLAADAAAVFARNTDNFRIYLPTDATGWTNVNPFDPATPPNARLRYVLESDLALAAQFPPQPLEAASLTLNGRSLVPGTDYLVTPEGLWWCAPVNAPAAPGAWGNVLGDPWPIDHTAAGTGEAYGNSKRLRLFFAQSEYRADDVLVTSLSSTSPALTVTRCPGGEPATTGKLQLGLDLALAVNPTLAANAESAFTSVSGETFVSTPIVSELTAGSGIQIDRLSPNPGGTNTGPLRISCLDQSMEGEISSIALRGAGEILYHNGVIPYLNFKALNGRPGTTAAVATFKLPAGAPTPLRLEVKTSVLGDTALPANGPGARAVFQVVYQAVRPGTALSGLTNATALALQYWTYAFPPSYLGFSLAPVELPTAGAGAANPYALTPATISPASPFYAPGGLGGLVGNDALAVYIARVPASADGTLVDNYAGQVGFLNLRWMVSAV